MLIYLGYLSALYCFLVYFVYQRSQKQNTDTKTALDLGIIIMVFGFLGARLLHIFYESPDYYAADFIRVFYIWQGGFVFYGGALLAFAACYMFLKLQKKNILDWMNFYAPILALGYGLGRLSCLIAGCCYGRTCNLPWAINGLHPTQLYATIWELSVFALLIFLERSRKTKNLFWIWLGLHAIGRLIMESFRDDFRGNFYLGMSISAWISFGLLAVAAYALALSLISSKSSRS